MEAPPWLKTAISIRSMIVEVGFCISASFYYGLPNGMTEQQWHKLREPLYQPRLPRYQNLILTQALQQSEEELVKYYLDVLRMSQTHQCEVSKTYFWMRPIIYTADNLEITFPWYDTWLETKAFLDQMCTQECGYVFSDADQGWDVDIYATSEQLFLREGSLDNSEEYVCIACNRQDFIEQIKGLRNRSEQILNNLHAAVGEDYWSG